MNIVGENKELVVYVEKIYIGDTSHVTNTYFILDKINHSICVIDPAYNDEIILKNIEKLGGNQLNILLTHGHADHIAAVEPLLKKYDNCRVYIHEKDVKLLNNFMYNESAKVKIQVPSINKDKVVPFLDSELVLKLSEHIAFDITNTPGHTQGSICAYLKQLNLLFCGDTIFSNCYGRCDLYFGSIDSMKKSIDIIFDKYIGACACPGHGEFANISEIEHKIRLLISMEGYK